MNLSERDRRALIILAVIAVPLALYLLFTGSPSSGGAAARAASAPADTVDRAEKTLMRLREQAAAAPAEEAILKKVSGELGDREKGLIKGDTAAQAQAQLLEALREVARNQTPPLEIRQVELGPARPFGNSYGQVSVSVSVECRIDQLVNYLAFLSSQPEIIATDEIRFNGANAKLKTMQVRLTISGIVPRKLVPVTKGAAAF